MMNHAMALAVLFVVPSAVIAADEGKPAAGNQATLGKQKSCPVTGSPIKENVSLDFHGTRIYFCCPGCVNKFKEEPAKYLPAAYEEIYPQKVQVLCPVMGGPADFKISTEDKGQRVYFCCKDCIKEFNANPAKFEKKLRDSFTDQVHDPVTGAPIDPQFSTKYKGREIYFATRDSMRKFKADPEKYATNALPQQGVLARGPSAKEDVVLCPKCGDTPASEAIRSDVKTAVNKDKTYFLCGTACADEFKSNPDAYASAVEKEMKSRNKASAAGGESGMQISGEPASPADTPAGHQGHQHHH